MPWSFLTKSEKYCAFWLSAYHHGLQWEDGTYLEIGINVGPPSYVEIALGDHRGHELSLCLETWKGLYEQRWNIYKMLRNEYKDNFISVGPLTVRVCTLQNNATLVRLDSSSVRMIMPETTLHRMFEFDGCIDLMFEQLVRLVDMVDVKYTQFSNIAFQNAIRDSDAFNVHQLVDCELLALVFLNTYEKSVNQSCTRYVKLDSLQTTLDVEVTPTQLSVDNSGYNIMNKEPYSLTMESNVILIKRGYSLQNNSSCQATYTSLPDTGFCLAMPARKYGTVCHNGVHKSIRISLRYRTKVSYTWMVITASNKIPGETIFIGFKFRQHTKAILSSLIISVCRKDINSSNRLFDVIALIAFVLRCHTLNKSSSNDDSTSGYRIAAHMSVVTPNDSSALSCVSSLSMEHRAVRLLSRRYKGLYEQRWNIYKMLRNEYKDNFISVGPLTVKVCTLNDVMFLRLDSSSVRMTMMLRQMFAFDGCIDVTFERLVRLVDTVDVKFTRFSNIASEDAIRDSDIFNEH
ncbi:hypothetical protein ALC57_13236 [Trachymyrmex cornetzi]|uniref:Uncharacterized protein n=1 Tax=Trachymyrmex cornetzi TaxID=471704 RepID=A0A151IZL0_9HYME|nr:hypothetical protein ALC57_13236 [Trachymyrmex cornetzi]